MDICKKLAEELKVERWQTEAAVKLIDEGNTIPFISRYRKEATGALNDEVMRELDERLRYLRNLEEKKAAAIKSISEQEKLTPELQKKIEDAETLVQVEDLYRPFRPKRMTRAMKAKEKGLQPLADLILRQDAKEPLTEAAKEYLSDREGFEVNTPEEALAGASDIIAESISENPELRSAIRKFTEKYGLIVSKDRDASLDEQKIYESYYQYSETVNTCPGHRTLAMNRGEKEKVLSVSVEAPDEQILTVLERYLITGSSPYTTEFLKATIRDSYQRLIYPAVEREIRSELTEKAEDGAITVFRKNLAQLLMQPPIAGKTVLGWDPGFRTGCKIAVVDPTGKVMDTTVVYPTVPKSQVRETKQVIGNMIRKYHVNLISLGNGTASRESEQVICDLIRELSSEGIRVEYIIVNEAGASVYSASKLATEEFPNFDVGQRSAASMARRLQDPLSELVKIDPKSVGVGQYQHDMDQKKLSESLQGVVEDCVNRVGVDLNTASAALLQYVSGISKTLAANIVSYREENGSFRTRKELLKVAKLGPKAYEQCAGFMRIRNGAEALDMTAVHPESYPAAKKLIASLGLSEEDIRTGGLKDLSKKAGNLKKLSEELGVGEMTLRDIVSELEKPGRDPRADMPAPVLRSDVLEMKDLKEGMILKGTVRNVIDFGCFVDIGVHQDGLVHISRICDRYIKHPLEAVSIGDVVEVKVLSVDLQKKRIALTMRF